MLDTTKPIPIPQNAAEAAQEAHYLVLQAMDRLSRIADFHTDRKVNQAAEAAFNDLEVEVASLEWLADLLKKVGGSLGSKI